MRKIVFMREWLAILGRCQLDKDSEEGAVVRPAAPIR
jgi:hypothetical protein